MIERFIIWLIKRDLKKREIKLNPEVSEKENEFRRVLNTLRENKVMVITKDDGIYIRLDGDEQRGQSYFEEFVRVKTFKK